MAAVALLLGLAAAFAMPPATTGGSAARAVAAIALGSLIALAVAQAPFTFAPRIRPAFVLLVLLALWYSASRAWATDPAGSMVEASRVAAFVLMAWASHTAVVGSRARIAVLAGVFCAAAFVAVPPFWDFLQDGVPAERVAGQLGYWNASAIVSLCLVPVAVAVASLGRRWSPFLAAVLLPIAAVSVVTNASRGALLALGVALVFQAVLDPDYRGGLPRAAVAATTVGVIVGGFALDRIPTVAVVVLPTVLAAFAFSWLHHRTIRSPSVSELGDTAPAQPSSARSMGRNRALHGIGAFLMAALVLLVVVLVVDAGDGDLPARAEPASTNVSRLASTDDSKRTEWWRIGIDIWSDAPIVGSGGGAFAAEYASDGSRTPDHVHSMPLEVALETGIVGLFLMVAASVQLLRVLRRGRRSSIRALAGAVAAMLIVQSFVDWTLSFPQIMALLALTGPFALQSPEPSERSSDRRAEAFAAVAMLGSLAAASLVAFVPLVASLLVDQGVDEFDAHRPGAAAGLFEQSVALVPSLDTLTLQVVSLQAAGRPGDARKALRDHQTIWSTNRDGLFLAGPLFNDDPKFGPLIARRIAQLNAGRAVSDLT